MRWDEQDVWEDVWGWLSNLGDGEGDDEEEDEDDEEVSSNRDLWKRVNWMDRDKIVALLQDVASIQCYDHEPTDELRLALIENVEDGTIPAEMLPEVD